MRSASGLSHKAGSMAFIYHYNSIVFISQVADHIQLSNRSVHTEHTVGNNNPASEMSRFFQTGFQVFHVVILIAITLRFTQANSIDNGSMVQRIGDNSILFVEQRFEYTAIGIEGSNV